MDIFINFLRRFLADRRIIAGIIGVALDFIEVTADFVLYHMGHFARPAAPGEISDEDALAFMAPLGFFLNGLNGSRFLFMFAFQFIFYIFRHGLTCLVWHVDSSRLRRCRVFRSVLIRISHSPQAVSRNIVAPKKITRMIFTNFIRIPPFYLLCEPHLIQPMLGHFFSFIHALMMQGKSFVDRSPRFSLLDVLDGVGEPTVTGCDDGVDLFS